MSENTRIGDWFQTVSGRKVYCLDPRAEDFDIEDAAHALSRICRYGGHVPGDNIYSVAQHSVYVAQCVSETRPDLALSALLHDAAEAYIGDVIRPIKRGGGVTKAWLDAEMMWGFTIEKKYDLPPTSIACLDKAIKVADDRVLLAERRDLLAQTKDQWREGCNPWEGRITPIWAPQLAKYMFLSLFCELRNKANQ